MRIAKVDPRVVEFEITQPIVFYADHHHDSRENGSGDIRQNDRRLRWLSDNRPEVCPVNRTRSPVILPVRQAVRYRSRIRDVQLRIPKWVLCHAFAVHGILIAEFAFAHK